MLIRLIFLIVCYWHLMVMALPLNEHLKDHREVHLRNVQQLTFGGENAEAYFSFDGKQLIYQATPRHPQQPCDQIFQMNTDGSGKRLLSTGQGRTTCSFFYPDSQHILYASTHEGSAKCPPPVDMSQGYVWALYADYDIYKADLEGNIVQKLTDTPGYDAEAVLSPRGDKIVFTSMRSGDLELWTMNLDGSDLQQLTNTPGYDGGAFFSPDGAKIVWRASRFAKDSQALADYQRLLKKGLIRPSQLEIFVMDADGRNQQQVTHLGKASFGPYFHPTGDKIIFSSNLSDIQGREFDLYLINIDGTGLERITYTRQFDGFPMFSPDGKKLVWGSNRHNERPRETNIFIADWVDEVQEIVPETRNYSQTPAIKAAELFHHVRFLADDRLTGRYPGTDGIEYAAHYIANHFAEYGLAPIGDENSYFQSFDFIGKVELGNNNFLSITKGTTTNTLILKQDYIPLAFSDTDEATGEVIFVGYGISAPAADYDDYANIEVKDKIVLMLRATPATNNLHNPLQPYATLRHKLVIAREKGAKAVLFVTGVAQEQKLNELVKFQTDFDFKGAGIAAMSISRAVANQILAVTGNNIADLQQTLDDTHQPNSFLIPSVQIRLKTAVKNLNINTRNVVGYLPGKTDKTIVIGAHYDHIGLGGTHSLDPKVGVIHNGADDNASGVAGMLELAHYFATQTEPYTHNLLFLAFSAEEFGLIGSKYYIHNPLKSLDKTVAMLNLDMIGHLRNNQLIIQGVGTSPVWEAMIDNLNRTYLLKLAKQKDGPGPSDQSSFYYKNIPVLAFFTGSHDYYNRSTDDFWRLNYPAQEKIVQFVRDMILAIDHRQEKLLFSKAESQHSHRKSEFKVSLGVIPDYAFTGKGLHLEIVRENRPGYKAGLRNGDIIIQFGTISIDNIYDYVAALGMFKPGDQVKLIFLRNGTENKTVVLLEE